MRPASLLLVVAGLGLGLLSGCGAGGEPAAIGDGGQGGDAAPRTYAIRADVHFDEDAEGIPFGTQNGATVHVPRTDVAGKSIFWATVAGGESIANEAPIDFGTSLIGDDLGARIETPARYSDGPWELAAFVSVAGGDASQGPQPGDLAAFDNSATPPGDPPPTGNSVRVKVDGVDTEVTLTNRHFIRF